MKTNEIQSVENTMFSHSVTQATATAQSPSLPLLPGT